MDQKYSFFFAIYKKQKKNSVEISFTMIYKMYLYREEDTPVAGFVGWYFFSDVNDTHLRTVNYIVEAMWEVVQYSVWCRLFSVWTLCRFALYFFLNEFVYVARIGGNMWFVYFKYGSFFFHQQMIWVRHDWCVIWIYTVFDLFI